ncbi:hypothetical protein BDP27DRAFT_387923 [Rhodocollybia butyracea]|uniref:BAG domain-containing protein n=1 Tax=Rhodocollybia butyracea TaxID=206335 RepID=A0A9P5Q0Y4_9AGAR|nr:hypothetical protein BDP27DRAFT_387923 [Rhodocollybia butyracea]
MFNPQPLVSSDAKKVATKPVAQPQAVDSSSRPVSTLSLKEQLEARLHNDESVEIQDTIQALLASLSDSHASATTSVPDASNHKGKGKASEPRPGPSTPSDALKALEAVQNIEASFIALQDDFEFPDDVDFSPTSSRSSSPSRDDSASNAESDTATIRKLGYTARNHPIRFYEQSLSRLLVQLDEIESNGNAELRVRRKAVVALVEGALEELEKKVEVRWIRWNKSHVRADREEDSEPSRNVEVADSEVPAETVSGITATAESAVASSFPLTAIEVESSDVDTSSPTTGEVVEEVTVDETDLSLNATNAVEDSFEAPSQPETEDDIANTDTNSLSVNLPLRVSTYASTVDAPASLSSPVISESLKQTELIHFPTLL